MALRMPKQNGRWRIGRSLAAVIVMSLLAASCGQESSVAGDWEGIVDRAAGEGPMVIGVHTGVVSEEFMEYAQDQLPDLDMDVTYIRPSDFTGRAISEQDSGLHYWDLYIGFTSNVYESLHPNYLEPIGPVLDDLPDDVKNDQDWAGGFEVYTDPADPRTFINEWSTQAGIYINRDLAPNFSNPEDLLDPQYRGMIGLYDPLRENQTSMSLAWFMETEGEDFVRDFFQSQEPQIAGDANTVAQWVAEGRVALALGADPDAVAELQEAGVGTSVERNQNIGSILIGAGVSVLRDPPNPNALRVFMHWFLSRDGQDAWARLARDGSNTRRLDADPSSYSGDTLPDYDRLDAYPVRPGTAEAGGQVDRAVEIASEYVD